VGCAAPFGRVKTVPAMFPLFGKTRFVVFPCAASATPENPQLTPRVCAERLRRLDDPRLDDHLFRRAVEVLEELQDRRHVVLDLPDDQGVRALVDDHVAARGHDALQRSRRLADVGVGEALDDGLRR
jgi:hypothetical protein